MILIRTDHPYLRVGCHTLQHNNEISKIHKTKGKFLFGHEKKLGFPFGHKKFQSYLMAMA
jgi:hypothetical protein